MPNHPIRAVLTDIEGTTSSISFVKDVLFPYARQTISTMVEQGGFPAFLMQPINFEQIYADNLKRRQAQAA